MIQRNLSLDMRNPSFYRLRDSNLGAASNIHFNFVEVQELRL